MICISNAEMIEAVLVKSEGFPNLQLPHFGASSGRPKNIRTVHDEKGEPRNDQAAL